MKSHKLVRFSVVLLLNRNETDDPVSNANAALHETSPCRGPLGTRLLRSRPAEQGQSFSRMLGTFTSVIAPCNVAL